MQKRNGYVALVIFAALGVAVGCSNSGSGDSGATTSSTPSASTAPTTAPAAPTTTAAAGTDGATLFAANCSGCHGDKGAGGKKAPKLAGKSLKSDEVVQIVTAGKGRMPAFGKRLSKEQIASIGKYAETL